MLYLLVSTEQVSLGGYSKGKIYGTLSCPSGKRMKEQHRVFFKNEQEALDAGYRPCGNCQRPQYKIWKLTYTNGSV